jgi:hypothetical protein
MLKRLLLQKGQLLLTSVDKKEYNDSQQNDFRMTEYSCRNCQNLKTKLITKSEISRISKYKIEKALKVRDPDSLDLMFPFNLTVYKRVLKNGECPVLYCSERMFNRDLYIHRENIDLDEVAPNNKVPCPKYK